MNSKWKKGLYESIIKNVSKEIKKQINESYNSVDSYKILNSLIGKSIKLMSYDFISDEKSQQSLNIKIAGYICEQYAISIIEKTLHIKNTSNVAISHIDFQNENYNFEVKAFNRSLTGNTMSPEQYNAIKDANADILAIKYSIKGDLLIIENAAFIDISQIDVNFETGHIKVLSKNLMSTNKNIKIGDIKVCDNGEIGICISNKGNIKFMSVQPLKGTIEELYKPSLKLDTLSYEDTLSINQNMEIICSKLSEIMDMPKNKVKDLFKWTIIDKIKPRGLNYIGKCASISGNISGKDGVMIKEFDHLLDKKTFTLFKVFS